MAAATACEPAAGSAASPATTPSWSASGRFWLSFHLASTRVTSTSTPTIALSWPAT